jgi:hypothetical protein
MKFSRLILFQLIAIVEFSYCKVNWTEMHEICGESHSDRIIGGTTAGLGSYPWIGHLGIMRHGENDDQFVLR